MAHPPWRLNRALAAVVVSKDLPVHQVHLVTTARPVWMVNTDTMDNMAETDKSSAVPSRLNHALSAHPDHLDHKDKLETKDPADPKERTPKTAKMETLDHKEWPDLPVIWAQLDHLAYPDPKESLDVSTKSTDQPDHMDLPAAPAVLDQKEIQVSMALLANRENKAPPEIKAPLVEKVYLAHPDPQANLVLQARLERAITAQLHELHQAIRHRTNGTHTKTLILGAFLLYETVLPFDNAQFLCFIFIVLSLQIRTTR